jgi:hypothetical protein
MNDVFLSYAARDRAVAQKFADAFEALGWSVWWDREIPFGKSFDQVIEDELNAARCVVVLWTGESVRSRWVKTEAAAAADRERLLPVLLEDVQIPLEFRRVQTAMLQGWNGDREHPEFLLLVESLKQMAGPPATRERAAPQAPRSKPPVFTARVKIAAAAVVVLALLVLWQSRNREETVQSNAASVPQAEKLEGRTTQQSTPTPSAARNAQAPAAQASGATGAAGAGAVATSPSKSPYRIRIGDSISEGVPAAGAGHIENPGMRDVYVFDAKGGERVYFRMFEHGKGMELIEWKLSDPEGAPVFDARLGYGNAGTHVLKRPGTYTMTVGSDAVPAVGTYRMKLFGIPPPQRFTIKIGEMISENTPAPGAGNIEMPGATDVYTFTAAAGQRIYFRMFEHAKEMPLIEWRLRDPDDGIVFDRRLGYGDAGVQVLKKSGTYTMSVGSEREPGTGTYRLQLTSAD